MKGFRKFLGLALTSVMMFTMLITTAYAAPTLPTSTSVTIHKIVSTSQLTLMDNDGHKLTADEITNLWPGLNAVENNTGVKFAAWKVPAGTLVTAFDGMTDQQVTDSPLTGDPVPVSAGIPQPFETGTYYVRETERPATLVSSLGVPFIMELPALNVAGDAYLTDLNLYPKNVIESDMPVIDKDVEARDQDHAGFDVGYTFNYLIYPKVPKGIQSYTVFKVSDTLASTLDYMGNVSVTYNGKNGAVPLAIGTDYTLTQSAVGTANGSFNLTFTAAGLQQLADNRPASETEKDLEIKFQARINDTAVMGANIYNDAVLTYNNGYFTSDKTIDVPQIKRPEVHTGGRQFIKVDNVTQTYLSGLASASFYVKNSDGKYMKKDNEGNVTWVAASENPMLIHVNANDGSFEVTGLAYGDNGEAVTYKLEEVDAPTGYVRMADMEFTINASSYGDKESISDNTKVINVKRPKIPQTGGIGTIIFLVTGLILMGAAIVALKRKEQTEK